MTTTPDVEVVEDFDAFWAAKRADQPHTRIRGVVVPIPMDLPLALVAQMQGATVASEDENKAILAEVYGADVIETWISRGMGAREFFVVLTWSFLRGSGTDISFAQAVERADEIMAALGEDTPGGGKPAAKAARKPRAKTGKATKAPALTTSSGSAGASSSRTSAASTGSRRKASAR